MALSEIDRVLLESCLKHQSRAWENFVDRFLGLVVHVVNHTAQSRSLRLNAQDREDLCADVFCTILENDFAVLRRFRGDSSLATYLTVISRRVVVREMAKRPLEISSKPDDSEPREPSREQRINDRDEIERLMSGLDDREANAVRMYHLEGQSYQDIGKAIGMPANSVGPMLSRARDRMRRAGQATL